MGNMSFDECVEVPEPWSPYAAYEGADLLSPEEVEEIEVEVNDE